MSKLGELANEAICNAFVGLMLNPNQASIQPYPYSGFVLEIEGRWYWITAAHCAQQISQALEAYPNSTLGMIVFTQKARSVVIPFAKGEWGFVDLQNFLKVLAANLTGPVPSDRDVRLFDMALWPIPNLLQCYLQNSGVVPFNEHQVPVDSAGYELAEGNNNALFAGGIPEATHDCRSEAGVMKAELKVFPLDPYPEDDRRVVAEGQFSWFPTGPAVRETWNAPVVGISGGPAILISDNRIYLLGLVAEQRPGGKSPEYLGVCNGRIIVDLLKAVIEEANREPADPLRQVGA